MESIGSPLPPGVGDSTPWSWLLYPLELVTLPPGVGLIWGKIKPYILLKSFKDFNPKRALHLKFRAPGEDKI